PAVSSPPAAPTVSPAITEPVRPAPRVRPGPLPRRHSRWPLALAAVLALAFAGTSVWLWQIRQSQSAEIAQLQKELDGQRRLAVQAGETGRQARTEMEK